MDNGLGVGGYRWLNDWYNDWRWGSQHWLSGGGLRGGDCTFTIMECGRAEIQHWMIGKGIDVRVHNSEWLLDELMLEGRRIDAGSAGVLACCGGKVHLSDCMCIQLGEKRGVRVYYSDQVVDLIRVADGGCRVCVAKGCPLYTELKDLLITRDEKWFIITEGKVGEEEFLTFVLSLAQS
ncbi:hypothetical protein T08_10305 [Trichinella sp. T8]|nr:hypothetical protein T08_10305 [Trichinella sp. T8]